MPEDAESPTAKESSAKSLNQEQFGAIFEALTDILQFTVDHIDKPITGEIPKDLEKRLQRIEVEVKAFREMNEQLLEKGEGAVTEGDLAHLSKAERRSLERSRKLIEEGKQKIEVRRKAEGDAAASQPSADKSAEKARKKQARSLGGRRNWKPL